MNPGFCPASLKTPHPSHTFLKKLISMTIFLLAVPAFLFRRNFLLKQRSAETHGIPNFKVPKFLSVLMLDIDFSSQFFKNKITWFSPCVTINNCCES